MVTAIIGANGAIGHAAAAAFHAAGQSVRLVGRQEAPLRARAVPGDEVVVAEVSTAEGCRQALAGAQHAVYAIGLPYSVKAFAAYAPMMETFVAAAAEAGISRALLITNVYPYGRPQAARVAEDHPRQPCSRKGEYRKQQEDIFLAAKGFEAVSLRLPDFYGPGVMNSLMTSACTAAKTGGAGSLLGPADRPHEFVFTPDVGPVVMELLQHTAPVSGAYNYAGAGIITPLELAAKMFRAAGRDPKLRVMPVWLQNALGLGVPVLRELAEMRYLLENPVLLDDAKLRALLPGLKKTSYEEGARLAVLAS